MRLKLIKKMTMSEVNTRGDKNGPLTDGQFIGVNQPHWHSVEQSAAAGLLTLLQGVSEAYYAAGWCAGTEFYLWNVQPGCRFGLGQISEREALLLRELSLACDGWWIWDENDVFGHVFVSRAEFQKIYDAWCNGSPTPSSPRS